MVNSGNEIELKTYLAILQWVKEIIEKNYRQRMPVDLVVNNRLLTLIPS
jgi:hypothetical protein